VVVAAVLIGKDEIGGSHHDMRVHEVVDLDVVRVEAQEADVPGHCLASPLLVVDSDVADAIETVVVEVVPAHGEVYAVPMIYVLRMLTEFDTRNARTNRYHWMKSSHYRLMRNRVAHY
jgi:hypothetical protein